MREHSEGESDFLLSTNLTIGAEISNLPGEILQGIFSHLDGKSLLICKRVCKTWRDNVHYFEKRKTFWYSNCQKEIPSWTQFDLLDNMFPYHWKDQNKVNWEEIYKSWCNLSCLYKKPVTISKFVTGIKGISSMKISGEWLLMSSCEGGGTLTARHLDKFWQIDIYAGGQAIINFELVNSDRHPHSNIKVPSNVCCNIFDTLEHNEIWIELKDCYIQLGKTYCQTVDKIQQRIRHSNGYEVRLATETNHSYIFLRKTCDKVVGPEIMQIELSSHYSQILDFWTNIISLSDLNVSHLIIDAVSVNTRTTQQASLACSLGYRLKAEHCDVYSWHGSLFVIYSSKRNIVIHYDGVEKEQVTPIKKGRVTSVLFYARYFLLGTERGQLLIYEVKSPKDCLDIIVYKTPCWSIEVCQGKIIHIAIAEPVHHKGKRPVIACATPEDVYLVSM